MVPEEAVAQLEEARRLALLEIEGASSTAQLGEMRVGFLGRKSALAGVRSKLGSHDEPARRELGKLANEVAAAIEEALAARRGILEGSEAAGRMQSERIDVTLPGRRPPLGRLHPITQVMEEIVGVFAGLGFRPAEGPEIETDWYNFQALNIPENHPARSMWDTLYLEPTSEGQPLMRTHTSPVQARTMQSQPPPVYVIVPGRCARQETPDPKRLAVFHQIEGLAVDYGIKFSDLKGTLEAFAKAMFGPKQKVKFIPTYYPFTEPSADMLVLCFVCEGDGCKTCRGEGWIEILGSGMVHPNVFRAVGYDPEITGFAFGMGVERIAMLRYGIPDIRWLYENDLRFLGAF